MGVCAPKVLIGKLRYPDAHVYLIVYTVWLDLLILNINMVVIKT